MQREEVSCYLLAPLEGFSFRLVISIEDRHNGVVHFQHPCPCCDVLIWRLIKIIAIIYMLLRLNIQKSWHKPLNARNS